MLKLEDIKSEEQVIQYIEGCLNDFEAAISTKVQTENYLNRLLIHLIKHDRKRRESIIERAFAAGRSQTSYEQFKTDEKL